MVGIVSSVDQSKVQPSLIHEYCMGQESVFLQVCNQLVNVQYQSMEPKAKIEYLLGRVHPRFE